MNTDTRKKVKSLILDMFIGGQISADELKDTVALIDPISAMSAVPVPTGMLAATSAKPKPAKAQRKPRAKKAPSEKHRPLLDYLIEHIVSEGSRIGTLQKQVTYNAPQFDSGHVKQALDLGISLGLVRSEGNKRATTYFLA